MPDEYEAALTAALRRLQASDRYESEVRRALSKYPSRTVDRVVAYLQENRLLDDERTTQMVVEFNEGRRAIGVERLRATLEQRGAPDELIENAVAATAQGDAERADLLLTTKFPTPVVQDRAKAGRFLYGRGFTEETIEDALERHFGSVPSEF